MLDVVQRRGDVNRAAMLRAGLATRQRGEVWQFAQREINLERGAVEIDSADLFHECGRQLPRIEQFEKGYVCISIGCDARGGDLGTVLKYHAVYPSLAGEDACHGGRDAYLRARCPCRRGQGLWDAAH